MRDRAGFTLIEIMVVIVVLAIVVGTIAPSLGPIAGDAQLRAATRDLIAALRYARAESVVTSRPHRLCVDSEAGRFWIEAWNEDEERGHLGFAPQREFKIGSSEERERDERQRVAPNSSPLPEGVAIEMRELFADLGDDPEAIAYSERLRAAQDERRSSAGGYDTVEFQPDGTADGRLIRLALVDDDEKRSGIAFLIAVDPVTGRVELREEESLR